MRVLSTATIFPGSATPGQGVFIKERLRGLPGNVQREFLRLRPWFPGLSWARRDRARFAPPSEMVDGIEVHDRRFFYLPGLMKQRDGDFFATGLRRFVEDRRGDFDLIDAHFAYPAGYAAVQVGRELDLPVCVTLRGTLASYASDARREKLVATLEGADRIIAVSQSLADLADELTGRDLGVRVIGNAVDRSRFSAGDRAAARARLGLESEGPVLLTVGGLVPRKGVHRVLEVLPAIVEEHPGLRYLVAGGGGVEGDSGAMVREQIDNSGLAAQVELLGAVPHAELADYYRAADLFVLATSNEGWANAIQEALACGCPVVTTDVGGNREVVGADAHGIVVPFGDPDALRDALRAALESDFDRAAISAWGGRRDWQDVGREVMAVFEEIL